MHTLSGGLQLFTHFSLLPLLPPPPSPSPRWPLHLSPLSPSLPLLLVSTPRQRVRLTPSPLLSHLGPSPPPSSGSSSRNHRRLFSHPRPTHHTPPNSNVFQILFTLPSFRRHGLDLIQVLPLWLLPRRRRANLPQDCEAATLQISSKSVQK